MSQKKLAKGACGGGGVGLRRVGAFWWTDGDYGHGKTGANVAHQDPQQANAGEPGEHSKKKKAVQQLLRNTCVAPWEWFLRRCRAFSKSRVQLQTLPVALFGATYPVLVTNWASVS